ncbi:MAG: hypothetical protein QUU85_04705, partial [Candidatus Eisenbacteria bacterium]|nr:hypothetical protein [Candidatus Eisenbacteria bacterium]
VDCSPEASVTIRASTLGGHMIFPPGSEREILGRARRRTVSVLGDGTAELRVDTLGGDITVRRSAE